jgi:hypothetical protein
MNKALESILGRVMCAVILTFSLSCLVYGQQQERLVDWHPFRVATDAKVLEIVGVKVNGESITMGKPFTANGDWLETLTFRVRNVSGKVIDNFAFGVAFPELAINSDGLGGPGFTTGYGGDFPKNAGRGKLMLPDEEVDLKLPADQVKGMRRASERMLGTPNLNKVIIAAGLLTFQDGSRLGGFSLRGRTPEKP